MSRFALIDLLHFLLQAVERIEEDTNGLSKVDFLANSRSGRQVRDAVVFNLGTLGEIANDIRKNYSEFATSHPDIPLDRMWDMRCHLFHGYHSINYEVVWTTCKTYVPDLERQIRSAINDLQSD